MVWIQRSCEDESIDELAAYMGVGEEVAAMTARCARVLGGVAATTAGSACVLGGFLHHCRVCPCAGGDSATTAGCARVLWVCCHRCRVCSCVKVAAIPSSWPCVLRSMGQGKARGKRHCWVLDCVLADICVPRQG